MNATSTSPRLSPGRVADYRANGYLILNEPVLPKHKFEGLKSFFENLLQALPAGERPEGMDVPHFVNTALFEWLLADEILDIVEPILGPDIALFSSHFICKPRGNGKRVPWHEDSSYWKGMIEPMEVVTLWLAIDPSLEENGCMYVIPRTHEGPRKGFSDYDPVDTAKNVFPTEITKSQRDESKAVPCILQPNEASLHDGRIMHGSEPNTSNLRRCGYTMRFISTRTRFNHEKFGEYHQIYLARGRDHAGNIYGDPAKQASELLQYRIRHGKTGH